VIGQQAICNKVSAIILNLSKLVKDIKMNHIFELTYNEEYPYCIGTEKSYTCDMVWEI
jgi:hypothetical protein